MCVDQVLMNLVTRAHECCDVRLQVVTKLTNVATRLIYVTTTGIKVVTLIIKAVTMLMRMATSAINAVTGDRECGDYHHTRGDLVIVW